MILLELCSQLTSKVWNKWFYWSVEASSTMFDIIKPTRIHQHWCYVKYTVFSPIFEFPQRRRRCTSTTERHNTPPDQVQSETFSVRSSTTNSIGGPSASKRRKWRQLYEEAGRRSLVSTRRTSIEDREQRSSSSDEGLYYASNDVRNISTDLRGVTLEEWDNYKNSSDIITAFTPQHVITFRKGVRRNYIIYHLGLRPHYCGLSWGDLSGYFSIIIRNIGMNNLKFLIIFVLFHNCGKSLKFIITFYDIQKSQKTVFIVSVALIFLF